MQRSLTYSQMKPSYFSQGIKKAVECGQISESSLTHWSYDNGNVVTFKNSIRLAKWVQNWNIDSWQLKTIRECIWDKMDFMSYNNPFQTFQCKAKHKQMLKTVNLLNLPAKRNPAVKKKKKKKVQVRILYVRWSSNFFQKTWSKEFQTQHSSFVSLYFMNFLVGQYREFLCCVPSQNMSMPHVKISFMWLIPLMPV